METERAEMVERCATLARENEGTANGEGRVSLSQSCFFSLFLLAPLSSLRAALYSIQVLISLPPFAALLGRMSYLEQLLEEHRTLLQETQSTLQAAAAAAHSPKVEHRSPNSSREGHGLKVGVGAIDAAAALAFTF